MRIRNGTQDLRMMIRKGSRGEEVKQLQRLLGITADGIFGNGTEAAVIAFQREHGLVPDGIVGPLTWVALETSATPSIVYMPLSVHITKSVGRPIKYLAIHYTAGSSSASGRARAVKSVFESRKASADFVVDDNEIVQFNPDIANYYCWAVGDTKQGKVNCPDGCNRNTISIEICSSLAKGTTAAIPNHVGWYFTDAVLDKAEKLAKMLMDKYHIPIERVVRHYDISGKLCPGIVGWNNGRLYSTDGKVTTSYNNSRKWLEFKSRL